MPDTQGDNVDDRSSDLPPDRSHVLTEKRMRESAAIDALATDQMLRLINTQDTRVPQVVRKAIPQIARLVDAVADLMHEGGRLIYVGTGTSGRLGVLDASECPPTFDSNPDQVIGIIAGGDDALRRSSEGREDEDDGPVDEFNRLGVSQRDAIIGITAGGTTPYVWGAMRMANQLGALAGMITCIELDSLRRWERPKLVAANQEAQPARRTPLPARVDYPIELPVGPEVITGSTRMLAGTATKLVLNMITTGVMVRLGKTWGNLMVDLRARNDKLRDRAARILADQCRLSRDQAFALLDRAEGHVKTALVMQLRNVDRERARQLLDEADGMLRRVVGPPR